MKTKHIHLLPVLSFLPLLAVLLAITQFNVYMDPLVIGLVSILYVTINVIYRHIHGTLKVGYIVEYSLVALIAYSVITLYA